MNTSKTAVTSETLKLSSIPKLDKEKFILSFVHSQKLYAKAYAEQGRAIWTDLSASTKPIPSADKENDYGFSTPILKPRCTKYSLVHKTDARTLKESAQPQVTSPSHGPSQNIGSQSTALPKKKCTSTSEKPIMSKGPHGLTNSRKRSAKVSDEEEHLARLAERRQRKRAKRAIVEAHTVVEGEKTTSDRQQTTDKKARKGIRASSKKLPALALVHGFSATNVGRNRLTAPPPVLGVFNKGKASVQKQVGSKKGTNKIPVKSSLFSETAFLNKRSRPPTSTSITTAPGSREISSESDCGTPVKLPLTKVLKTAPKTRKAQKLPAKGNKYNSPSGYKQTASECLEEERVESEVWDIELDEYVLPSKVSSQASAVASKQGVSITSNIRDMSWMKDSVAISSYAQEPTKETTAQEVQTCFDNRSELSTSTSSLAPSQSASQRAPTCQSTSPQVFDSKYFKSQKEHTKEAVAPSDYELDTFPISSHKSPLLFNVNERLHDTVSGYQDAPDSYDLKEVEERHSITCRQGRHFATHSAQESPAMASPQPLEPLVRQSGSTVLSQIDQRAFVFPSVDFPLNNSEEDMIITPAFYPDDAVVSECSPYTCNIRPLTPTLPSLNTEYDANNYWGPDFPIDAFQAAPDADMFADDQSHSQYNWRYENVTNVVSMDYGHSFEDNMELEAYPVGRGRNRDDIGTDYRDEEEEEEEFNEFSVHEDQGHHYDYQCIDATTTRRSLCDADPGDDEGSVFEVHQHEDVFLQGRELLLGFSRSGSPRASMNPGMGRMSMIEADVARQLKEHWLPQKL